MRVLVFLFFIVGCWCDIRVSIDQNGRYNISIGNHIWLRSADTALYVDNKWYSSHDNTLPLIDISFAQGTDSNLGNWNETQLNYDLVRNGTHTKIVGRIRQWYSYSAITFHLDTGDQIMTNTVPLTMDTVRTVFPSFNIEQIDSNDQRGYFTIAGEMAGDDDKHAGWWNSSNKVIKSGMNSGPVVLFNFTQRGENDILVLSPFSRFMATSLSQTNNRLEYGVMGSILTIPTNYNHSMIVFYSSEGINEGIRKWGKTMQKAFNRTNENRLNDLTINYLGYYTDNGAYYYYNTEQGMNYEQTMINVHNQIPLPFHYIQLDSWWYYKGIGGGVTQYTPMPNIFPDGLPALHRRLENIPLAAHNRYWAYDTVYKQNYSFVLDEKNGKALPIGNDSFWLDLFTQTRDWGLILYEQDWLDRQTYDFLPTYTDIHIGHQWLMSMGEAADKIGINIQYCMALPRHILTALQIPRVTHARVSTDYAFHLKSETAPQWAIGISSMFADALGLAPFKDVFWSNSYEPGAPYSDSPREILPEREILIATLSTGPVGPGDGINYTNVERIMKCCRQDGLILKPDRPLTMINRLASDWAFHNGILQGELYSTQTTINSQTFHVIFASALKQDYSIYPSMIKAQPGVVWSYDDSTTVSSFSDVNPLNISHCRCSAASICLWYVSPLIKLTESTPTIYYALLGESNKWTPISQQRIRSIDNQIKNNIAIIGLQGAPNELVSINIFHTVLSSTTITCPMASDTGVARLIITSTNMFCGF